MSSPPRNRNSSQTSMVARLMNALRNLLSVALWPFISLLRLLMQSRGIHGDEYDGLSAAVTAKASQQFVAYLRGLYHVSGNGGSNTTLAWLTTGFAAAQEQATQRQSLLLVYLHSPLHRSSENFCKGVLCNESMSAFINQPRIIAFGVSIHTAQGAYLAQLFQTSCYPFLALLQPKLSTSHTTNNNTNSSTSAMTLLLRAEGPALSEMSVQQILPHFQAALQRHQAAVADADQRRLQRQEESDLRRQQDEEYQATLRADQERERLQREVAEREAQQARQLEEEARRQQAQVAAALDNARAQIPEEPPVGSSESITSIRFVLPSGIKLNRRFYSHETIAGLIAYLTIYFHENGINMSRNIGLSTNFPKKSYNEDQSLTLEEAGLAPQAVLMVQDLDA